MIAVGRSRLGMNAVYQVGGQVLPMLVGIVSIPILLTQLGHAKFGIFTVVLMISNFMTLLDLGIGRAVVRFAAAGIGKAEWGRITAVLVISTIALGAVSLLVMAGGFLALPYASEHWFQVPQVLRSDLSACLAWVLITLPAIVLTSIMRGYLEAHEHFARLNAIVTLFGVLNYLAPMLVALVSHSIVMVSLVFLGVLVLRFIALAWASWRLFRANPAVPDFGKDYIREYWGFLSWLTLANILGATIVYTDRFIASGQVNIAHLPYYTVPLDFISRTLIIANALSAVLLSAFSKEIGSAEGIIERVYVATALILTPMFIVLAAAMPWILQVWLGNEFRVNSTAPSGYFIVGCAFATFNVIAVSKVLADGSSRRLALLYLLELPVYATALKLAGASFGLVGLSATWAARAAFEYFMFNYLLLRRLDRAKRRRLDLLVNFLLPGFLAATLVVALTDIPALRFGLALFALAAFFWAVGRLDPTIGEAARALLGARHHRFSRGLSDLVGRVIK